MTHKPKPLGGIVAGVMAGLGFADPEERRLFLEWTAAVGPELGAVCFPGRLDRDVLHVYTKHPAASMEATLRAEELRGAVNRFLGRERVRDVRVTRARGRE